MQAVDEAMAALDPALRREVEAWMQVDPDPTTRAELEALLVADARAELNDRFGQRLAFGTSGIRGQVGAGPNRMNRVVLRRMVAGVMKVLGPGITVVLAHDARTNSDVFCADAAAVVAAYGGHAVVVSGPHPTPVLAFAVLELDAQIGLMVTASHNPPKDNGCKVFLGDGAQLRSPLDQQIEAAIEGTDLPPLAIETEIAGGTVRNAPQDLVQRYLSATVAAVPMPETDLRVAYTPLHGVGAELLIRAFERAGVATPSIVEAQHHPDPAFPTVAFPNPEEPGAMDLVMALGTETNADLVVANDPDADRLAIAVPDATAATGWRSLTGDEVGALLADHVLAQGRGSDRLVVSTVVCSRLVERIAEAAGVRHANTLTGFKWIASTAFAGPERFAFCYEESLGYAVSGAVHDKDGISAALAFVAMATAMKERGLTVSDRLAELAVTHGLHTTRQRSVRFSGPGSLAAAGRAVDALRTSPPKSFGDLPVLGWHDFAAGNGLPPTNLLRFELPDGIRVMIRPSGTEAKTKIYLEQVQPVSTPLDVPAARAQAHATLDALMAHIEAKLRR